jgi:hypothetical protein
MFFESKACRGRDHVSALQSIGMVNFSVSLLPLSAFRRFLAAGRPLIVIAISSTLHE